MPRKLQNKNEVAAKGEEADEVTRNDGRARRGERAEDIPLLVYLQYHNHLLSINYK
jgi:hypothetical protein